MSDLLKNQYRILSTIGQGGFGKTFLAEDTHMPDFRRCVIKQLKPQWTNPSVYQTLKERFGREAAILYKLGDNNKQIPTLYASFTENQEFYLAQEWINGTTLTEQYGKEGAPTPTALCKLLTSLLDVLEYVHKHNMIHRDIKPDNVIIRTSDGKPVLIDFGAVKEVVTASVDSQGMPRSSIIIGTRGYMPPEQAVGHPVFSSDLYSLGFTAIFLLTGKHPHQFQDSITGEIDWHPYASGLDRGLVNILDKATKQSAKDRYQTASAMNEAIKALNKITIPVPQPRPKRSFPSKVLLYAAAVLTLVLAGGLIVSLQLYGKRTTEPTCVLYNDDVTQQTVNVRTDCDKRSCDADASTKIGEYPNTTQIRLNRGVTQKSKNKDFDWIQIVIEDSGQVVWVASSKIRCS